ncbi:MAG: ATP-binding protein [Treponema sp.]|nr:ATP-binding protein [Treponema sp.]
MAVRNKKMIRKNNRQNELLNTVNQISMILLEPDMIHLKSKFMLTMNILAKTADVDRITIWKNHSIDGQLYSSLIFEWPSADITGKKNNATQNVPYEGTRWESILLAGECINSPVSALPAAEQKVLKIKGVSSIFIAPVFVDNTLWGYIGFDDCHRERKFTDNESLILHSAGRMLGSAYIRNEMTQNLLETTSQLKIAKEQAEQSSRTKSIFLSHMSHEIRTPMNAILGIAEIQLQNENLGDDVSGAFEKIYESGDLLLNIINDILDLSKIESGNLNLVPVKYDLPSLINDTTQLNRLRYESKPIEFSLQLDENLPLALFGDELRIKQILNNILSNAFKYTDEGKITYSVSIEPVSDDEMENSKNAVLVFSVSDTGQGMTEDQLGRIFDEYARFNLETNRTKVGAGLGMSIAKRLVDLMDGRIIIESTPGVGSVFTVRLVQKRQGNEVFTEELINKLKSFNFRSSAIVKKIQFLREYMPYGSVLIVDDVESNLYVAKGMMVAYGLKIDTANSGLEAIEKIKNGGVYDIIFMDHMMPKMDGMETVKIIRSMRYTQPIVALTANALVGRAKMFLQNGFDGFLSKPIDSRDLNMVLIEFIKNRKPPEVVEAARRMSRSGQALSDNENKRNRIIEFFIRDAENAVNLLDKKPDFNEEMDLYITAVHGMKSALANVGEKEYSEFAAKLEDAGRQRNFTLISNETPEFVNVLKALVASFKTEENNYNIDEKSVSQENQILLNEKLNEIIKACEELDKKYAKTILKNLKTIKWPEKINAALDKISVHLLHSEFTEIEELVKELNSSDFPHYY